MSGIDFSKDADGGVDGVLGQALKRAKAADVKIFYVASQPNTELTLLISLGLQLGMFGDGYVILTSGIEEGDVNNDATWPPHLRAVLQNTVLVATQAIKNGSRAQQKMANYWKKHYPDEKFFPTGMHEEIAFL